MHDLFIAVLHRKDLSKAGDLFSLEDNFIVQDIQKVIATIQEIITQPSFLSNHNDQSLVEICITRITSAIRETRTIEDHAECLVSLLVTCLGYNLRPLSGGPDPPHAKLASDVMSCIFLNYGRRNVMQLALPVSVKFLHKGNKELSRNMSSYLSLAAIENAELLAQHIQPIIDSVISGNYSLARVLPQIYSVNREPLKNHVMTLVSIITNCENTEILALLSLFSFIAKDSPAHLEPSIPQLCECLSSSTLAQATLQVFYNMALQRPQPLADHFDQFKRTAENCPKSSLLTIQLMSVIAKSKQEKAAETLDFIISIVGRMESEKHSYVLKEVIGLTSKYPHLLTAALVNKMSSLDESGATSSTKTYVQELKNDFNHQLSKKQLEKLTIKTRYHTPTAATALSSSSAAMTSSLSNNNINNNLSKSNRNEYHIGTNSNAVTVVRVGGQDSKPDLYNNTTSAFTVPTTDSRTDVMTALSARDILTYSSGSRDVLYHLPNHRDTSLQFLAGNRDSMSHLLSGHRENSNHYLSGNRDTMNNVVSNMRETQGRENLISVNSVNRDPSCSIVTSRDFSSVGSRDVLSYAQIGSREFPNASREVIAAGMAKEKLPTASRSTGRLPTHRSMTKLNSNIIGSAGLDNKVGLHKSMSRLNTSQQNMARFSSSSQTVVLPATTTVTIGARSVTCINGTRAINQHYPPTYGHHITSSRGGAPGGSASPTKSMSSGSMSMDPNSGREVLTVNVNQINQDLIRQVSSVLSHHDIYSVPSSGPSGVHSQLLSNNYLNHHATITPTPHNGVPFSLPSHSSRRVGTYSSGPLPTPTSSQPPSLGIPPPTAPPTSHVFPLPDLSKNVSSQPLSSSTAIYNHPNSAATTRKNLRKNSNPNISTRGFSNTLPSPRRRNIFKDGQTNLDSDGINPEGSEDGGIENSGVIRSENDMGLPNRNNRASVFEPYPMRDTVQHFCEKHLNKIKTYMESLCVKLPLPVKCTIEERKGRKHAKLHFACQGRSGEHCLYKATLYTMKTRNPRTWIHLMFLALQARSTSAISTRETSVSALKNCWDILKCENISFVTLVTGAFPPAKAQDTLLHELRSHRFFDVFEYNGPLKLWGCFLCNHPDRASNFITEQEPVIEGQLKEKKGGKWKLFKRWKNRYFTLSGARLSYKDVANGEPGSVTQSLDIGSIRSVKVSKEGRRNIPKAFEIFTADKTFILKAKDGSNAQEWVQCLSVARAHNEAKDNTLRKLAYGGSLGRLNQHGRVPLHHHAINSNMALRTNV